MKRTALRSGVALEYSRGFNPQAKLSLACPRPVGVTARDELLTVCVVRDLNGDELLRRLNDHAPCGVRFFRAERANGSRAPQPRRAGFELPLCAAAVPTVRKQLDRLDQMDRWPVQRRVRLRRSGVMQYKDLDLRPLVERMRLCGETLHWSLVRRGDRWARPAEVLTLVGLDGRVDLARAIRTDVEYDM